jgi:hypothetical protein
VAQGVQRSVHPDRYDAAQATAQRLIERARNRVTPPPNIWKDTMRLIQSAGRGTALLGPGYYRIVPLDEEVHAAVRLVGNPVIGNYRQFGLEKHRLRRARQGTTWITQTRHVHRTGRRESGAVRSSIPPHRRSEPCTAQYAE